MSGLRSTQAYHLGVVGGALTFDVSLAPTPRGGCSRSGSAREFARLKPFEEMRRTMEKVRHAQTIGNESVC